MTALDTLRNNGLETLLQRYAVNVDATSTRQLVNPLGPHNLVGEALPQATFSSGAVRFYDQAPQYYAVLDPETEDVAQHQGIFRFSKPAIDIPLSDQNSPDAVEVYLIPYEENTSIGVKLPAGQQVAYAVTASMNGCTLSVSGDPASPLAVHSNVQETPDFSKAGMLSVRLDMLKVVVQNRMAMQTDITSNPTRLEVFADQQAHGVTHVDYVQSTVRHAGTALQQMHANGLRGAVTTNHFTSYVETEYKPRIGQIQDLFSQDSLVNLTMMGERRNGVWRFYFQQHTVILFDVWDVTRQRITGIEQGRVKQPGSRRCAVILNSGEFWPNRTDHPEAF